MHFGWKGKYIAKSAYNGVRNGLLLFPGVALEAVVVRNFSSALSMDFCKK